MDKLLEQLPEIEKKLGYTFKDRSLLVLAFIHRSYTNENKKITEHNERIEFLGDSVLGLTMANYLYNTLPDVPEGQLSYLRSRLVDAVACLSYMEKLQVADCLLLGKGEKYSADGRGRDSINADLFEALVGAVYLDGGFEAAQKFVISTFATEMTAIIKTPWRNWKAALQDYCQKTYHKGPHYHVLDETGPDHSKVFMIAVMLGEQELGRGSGASKKEAQQAAAEDAMRLLGLHEQTGEIRGD